MTIEQGSRWSDSSGVEFVVIATAEINGNIWVHYRKSHATDEQPAQEYSCFQESFQQRFRQNLN